MYHPIATAAILSASHHASSMKQTPHNIRNRQQGHFLTKATPSPSRLQTRKPDQKDNSAKSTSSTHVQSLLLMGEQLCHKWKTPKGPRRPPGRMPRQNAQYHTFASTATNHHSPVSRGHISSLAHSSSCIFLCCTIKQVLPPPLTNRSSQTAEHLVLPSVATGTALRLKPHTLLVCTANELEL